MEADSMTAMTEDEFLLVEQGASLRPVRIVLVDDSPDFLEALCAMLEPFSSLEIIGTGSSGAEAVDLVMSLHPDLVLMDVNMPDVDGIDAALTIAHSSPHTRILLMSSDDSQEMRGRCRRSMADGFIAKRVLASRLRRELE